MPKQRTSIPKAISSRVLREFRHGCAICGRDEPQIHHIDKNPANNQVDNLLPLCPNCHLIDQHDPTAPSDPLKLKLFRRYRDPAILSSQFHPLYLRLRFLLTLEETYEWTETLACTAELTAFVRALNMGDFYSGRIRDLLAVPQLDPPSFDASQAQRADFEARRQSAFKDSLIQNREKATRLVIEMLRYQDWPERMAMSKPRGGYAT